MKNNRRAFLRVLGRGVIALPLGSLTIGGHAFAAEGDKLNPEDPAAKSLAYSHQSTDSARRCGGCQFYTVAKDTSWGPCVIFPGKLVSTGGVCNSWYAKA
jgi:hypothetical protein